MLYSRVSLINNHFDEAEYKLATSHAFLIRKSVLCLNNKILKTSKSEIYKAIFYYESGKNIVILFAFPFFPL